MLRFSLFWLKVLPLSEPLVSSQSVVLEVLHLKLIEFKISQKDHDFPIKGVNGYVR